MGFGKIQTADILGLKLSAIILADGFVFFKPRTVLLLKPVHFPGKLDNNGVPWGSSEGCPNRASL